MPVPRSASGLLNVVAACALALLGCGQTAPTPSAGSAGGGTGGTTGGTPDGGTTPDPGYQTEIPPTPPLVVPGSGKVLVAPIAVPAFFPGDSLQAGLVSFLMNYVNRSPSYQVVKEYGVGATTIGTPVVLHAPDKTSLTDADVKALVKARVTDGSLPHATADTMYLLYFPQGTTITVDGEVSCQGFGGYHQTVTLADGSIAPYVVVPRCSRATLGDVTATSSHELAEAVTDPFLTANQLLGTPYGLWTIALSGNEIADMCQNLGDFAASESGVGVVSRLWSNAAASARKNPCLPAPAGTPFFSVPVLRELTRVVIDGAQQDVETVPVAAGASQTVEVHLLADVQGMSVTVTAAEVTLPGISGQPLPAVLSLSFTEAPGRSRASGQTGGVLHLQIAAHTGAPAGLTTVLLTATGPTQSGGQTQTQWVAAVRITGS